MSHLQGLVLLDLLETLKMGRTSSPEKLVSDQKMTPGKNPKSFIQLYSVFNLRARQGVGY